MKKLSLCRVHIPVLTLFVLLFLNGSGCCICFQHNYIISCRQKNRPPPPQHAHTHTHAQTHTRTQFSLQVIFYLHVGSRELSTSQQQSHQHSSQVTPLNQRHTQHRSCWDPNTHILPLQWLPCIHTRSESLHMWTETHKYTHQAH